MLDFPNAPTVNQVFGAWLWDGAKWIQNTVSPSGLLPLAGGVMTGGLKPAPAAGLVGVTTGANAPAGAVGEILSATGTASMTGQGIASQILSLTLTPGDWDIQGDVFFAVGGSGTNLPIVAVNTSVALPTAPAVNAAMAALLTRATSVPNSSNAGNVGTRPVRVNVAAATTYYLIAQAATYTSTGVQGALWARRVR
jgi:hypothetical protein